MGVVWGGVGLSPDLCYLLSNWAACSPTCLPACLPASLPALPACSNELTGTIPNRWNAPGGSYYRGSRTEWKYAIAVRLQGNRLTGHVPCCEVGGVGGWWVGVLACHTRWFCH